MSAFTALLLNNGKLSTLKIILIKIEGVKLWFSMKDHKLLCSQEKFI